MAEAKRVCFMCILIAMLVAYPSFGADFSAQQGYTDNEGNVSLSGNSASFSAESARWFWHLDFVQPGTYAVSAQLSVSPGQAGSAIRIGNYVPEFGEGSSAESILSDTGGSAQWIPLGDIVI